MEWTVPQGPFKLWDPSSQQLVNTISSGESFEIDGPRITWLGKDEQYRAVQANNVHNTGTTRLHWVTLCFKGESEGEYIETILANGHPIRVGVEVEGEDEVAKINLANMGIDIPNMVVQSFYESVPHEYRVQWAILNDKWRELLENHRQIKLGKGNYESLVESLRWFGYGDLVEPNEVWSYDTEDGIKYNEKPLGLLHTDRLMDIMTHQRKTTYLTLRHLSDKWKYATNIGGMIITGARDVQLGEDLQLSAHVETNPDVKWSLVDMYVKMALLGYYFETYMMPIHLDLMRSVVEVESKYELTYNTIHSTELAAMDDEESYIDIVEADKVVYIDQDGLARGTIRASIGEPIVKGNITDRSYRELVIDSNGLLTIPFELNQVGMHNIYINLWGQSGDYYIGSVEVEVRFPDITWDMVEDYVVFNYKTRQYQSASTERTPGHHYRKEARVVWAGREVIIKDEFIE